MTSSRTNGRTDATKRILVATDLSDGTDAVVEQAERLAQRFDALIRVVHVVPSEPVGVEYREREAEVQKIGDRLWDRQIVAKALLVQGPTVETILEEAERWDTDLIVMGVKRDRASSHCVLGAVSDGVIRGAPCPVMVVPAGANRG